MPSLDPFHQAGAFVLGAVQPITPTVLNPTLFHEGLRISQLSLLCPHLLPHAPLLHKTKPSGVLHFQQEKFQNNFYSALLIGTVTGAFFANNFLCYFRSF